MPPEPPPPDDSIPPTTWWIAGAGVAVLLLAGAFVWLGSNRSEDVASVPPAPEPDEEVEAPATSDAAAPVELPPDPLNITKRGLDARARSRAWNADSAIARVHLEVDGGRPIGSIEFEYGVPQGPLVPGAALHPERLIVSVPSDGGAVTQREGRATQPQKALTEPNCPFDFAFQKLIQTGVSKDQRISAEYIFSARHARPVFQFTTADARQHFIDADQCQIVVR